MDDLGVGRYVPGLTIRSTPASTAGFQPYFPDLDQESNTDPFTALTHSQYLRESDSHYVSTFLFARNPFANPPLQWRFLRFVLRNLTRT